MSSNSHGRKQTRGKDPITFQDLQQCLTVDQDIAHTDGVFTHHHASNNDDADTELTPARGNHETLRQDQHCNRAPSSPTTVHELAMYTQATHASLPKCTDMSCECHHMDFYKGKPLPGQKTFTAIIQSNHPDEQPLCCMHCDHNKPMFKTTQALCKHARTGCPAATEQHAYLAKFYRDISICPKCKDPFTSQGLSNHVRKCQGKPQKSRQPMIPDSLNLTMDEEEATRFNKLFDEEFMAISTVKKPQQSTSTKHADAFETVRREQGRQIQMEAQQGINTPSNQAAWSSLTVFQKLILGPGSGKHGKATTREMNQRIALFCHKKWAEVHQMLTSFARPIGARPTKTEQQNVKDTVRRIGKAMQDGNVSKAFANAASNVKVLTAVKGYTDHIESLNVGSSNVSIDEHIASLIASATDDQKERMRHTSINHDTLEKALWKLNKGAAPGIDGITRDDLLAFPREALHQMLLQGLNGSIPSANRPIMAGASPTFLSKPGKPDTAVRGVMPQSMLVRLMSTYLNKDQESVIKRAVGEHQAAVMVKKGAEQLAFLAMAHMDQHEDSVILQTDAKNGFPSVKRKAMATLLLQEAPELLGYFHTCYGQSPLMAYVEFDSDSGEYHRRVDYTIDGLLMGEGLASAFFTMQNKLPRIINNARPGCTDKGYIDDFIEMCRLGDAIPDYSQHPLAQMLTTTKEHMHTWGGTLAIGKTKMLVNKMTPAVTKLHAALNDIMGGAIQLVCPNENAEVIDQGITLVGVPIGSNEYIQQAWQKALGQKTMHPNVFLALPKQTQLKLVEEVMTRRLGHLMRTDIHGELTLQFRKDVDDMYLGKGDGAQVTGYVINAVMGIDAATLPPKEVNKIILRLRMQPQHGGLGLTSQETAGQYAVFAGIAGLAQKDCIVRDHPAILWLRQNISNQHTNSAIAKVVRQQLDQWASDHKLGIDDIKDNAKRQLGNAPREPWELVETDNTITQRAMATAVSTTATANWMRLATESQKQRHDELKEHYDIIPMLVLPTAPLLKIPDQPFCAALCAATLCPQLPPQAKCFCGKPMTRIHAMTCKRVNKQTNHHNHMVDCLRRAATACRVQPERFEPRGLPHTLGFTGGPDLKLNNLPIHNLNDKTCITVDFTAPTASAASNDKTHGRKEPGQAAKAAELRKITHTDCDMHALHNNMDFVPAALEKDTCHVGQGLHTLLTRITSAREGETFEPNDMPNQYGFKEGTWNTPTAYRFWLAVLLVQNVLRRELQIDNVYRQITAQQRAHLRAHNDSG
jgi:hypothetical protein